MTITHLLIPGRLVEVSPIEVTVNGMEAFTDENGVLNLVSENDRDEAMLSISFDDGSSKEKHVTVIAETNGRRNLLKIIPPKTKTVTAVTVSPV